MEGSDWCGHTCGWTSSASKEASCAWSAVIGQTYLFVRMQSVGKKRNVDRGAPPPLFELSARSLAAEYVSISVGIARTEIARPRIAWMKQAQYLQNHIPTPAGESLQLDTPRFRSIPSCQWILCFSRSACHLLQATPYAEGFTYIVSSFQLL